MTDAATPDPRADWIARLLDFRQDFISVDLMADEIMASLAAAPVLPSNPAMTPDEVSGLCAWCDNMAIGTAVSAASELPWPSCGAVSHGRPGTFRSLAGRSNDEPTPVLTMEMLDELRELWHTALEREGNLASAVADVVWKATAYGTTEDGDVYAYIVPKGCMHRLVGVAQSNGAHVPVAFRNLPEESGD